MKEIEKAIACLYEPARAASDNAYSPYSGASVGASVLDEQGNVDITNLTNPKEEA